MNTDTLNILKPKSGNYLSRDPTKQNFLVIKDNLTFRTSGIIMSPIEKEICELEALECKAILKRDTSVLRTLWFRDFTVDDPLNEVVIGKNPLPYYVSFSRMVENFSVLENMVFTSGYELVQRLKANAKIGDPVKRNYFHKWVRKNGVWKLASKTHL
jgi:hypothetical protein